MKQGVGTTVTINIMAIFIVVTFAFLVITLNYYKAYKVNNIISTSIEKFEGYNELSKNEIESKLTSIGYVRNNDNCPTKYGQNLTKNASYCVYLEEDNEKNTYKYVIVTYLNMQIPIINQVLNLPVKTTTETIYKFSE